MLVRVQVHVLRERLHRLLQQLNGSHPFEANTLLNDASLVFEGFMAFICFIFRSQQHQDSVGYIQEVVGNNLLEFDGMDLP